MNTATSATVTITTMNTVTSATAMTMNTATNITMNTASTAGAVVMTTIMAIITMPTKYSRAGAAKRPVSTPKPSCPPR